MQTTNKALNFQSIIMTLQKFWADYGCLIWQPYYTQVGAGTMNPATFLRVLGPEPWNVGYVEPSIRPDDGRYGENPNRMQMHYQFQVILKPDPGNPQDIYLESLKALGIDLRQHDVRFVEDNWQQPALGAWGLGWEVWLDGQEITQFTYFQQAGGITLDPVSVELTYGLERIAMALQGVDSFRDIKWSPSLTDGDVNLQAEQEHSKYYFEIAEIERLRKMFELFETESNTCLEQGLVLPAYDYLLKCSHTFNVLDTRGAVGVTERQALFGRMRDIARRTAEAYLEQRQHLEYPWLGDGEEASVSKTQAQQKSSLTKIDRTRLPTLPAPFLLEIGTEELPTGDLESALSQLRVSFPQLLATLRLEHGPLRVMGTPRRLVVYVEDLAVNQTDIEQLIKGPPADRAYDASGAPTKAAEGFARSKGMATADLQVREMDGGRYVVAVVRQVGRPALEVLAEDLPELLASIHFDKPMRWNSSNVAFSRPIRWLLALYGEGRNCQIAPFEYAGLASGNVTRGLRFLDPQEFKVESPAAYFKVLADQGILLDGEERRRAIEEQTCTLASQVNGIIPDDVSLFAEVTNLVEAPTALRGSFDRAYLDLPREVLISVMKKHQRYFPVLHSPKGAESGDKALLPYFVAVRNGGREGMDLVVDGNQHVIRARFADAAYFVRDDLKQPLQAYLPELSKLTFQTDLGSMLDKTYRLIELVDDIGAQLGLGGDELVETRRAAELCKADLATKMVVEMTSLQGLMGRYYALNSGEPEAVAQAIYEHYLPRFAGDDQPSSLPGLAVGLADRLDSLAGLFAAGLAPSGNKDPFAQRRTALGLVQNLITWDQDFDIKIGLSAAADRLPIQVNPESQVAALDFIIERLRYALLEAGRRYDVVDAVLAAQGNNPARADQAVKTLTAWVTRPDWSQILPAYARCVRITRDLDRRYPVDEAAFAEPLEAELYAALRKAESAPRQTGSVDDFLNAFLPMIPVISRFFDEVLVMAEDERLRRNRLGLLQRISALAVGVADMSRLEGF